MVYTKLLPCTQGAVAPPEAAPVPKVSLAQAAPEVQSVKRPNFWSLLLILLLSHRTACGKLQKQPSLRA